MKSGLFIAFICSAAFIAHAQPSALRQPLPTVNDAELSDYLTRLATNISAPTNNHLHYTVIVLASDSINAYALPSGELYVTRGLIKAVTNEAEIVFVLAQQLSSLPPHARAHHTRLELKKPSAGHSILVGLVSGILVAFGGPAGAKVGAMVIAQEIGHRSSPRPMHIQTAPASFITDADKVAVEYLHEAGYDPEAALAVLEKLRTMRPKNYVRQSQMPPPVTFIERMRLVRNRIARLERKEEYLLDSSTFKTLKDRLGEQPKPASQETTTPQLKRKLSPSSSN